MNLWQSPPQGEEPFEALRERLFSNVISLLALLTTVGGLILLMRLYLIGLQPFWRRPYRCSGCSVWPLSGRGVRYSGAWWR